MRRYGGEQDQPGGGHHGAGRSRRRAGRPVPEALVEQRDADRRRDHGIDDGHRGQRRGQPGAPVGRLREQQPAGREHRDRREVRPQPARRARTEALGHGLGEHRGHAEGRTGRRGQQHAAQHRPVHPVRRQEQRRHPGPGHEQQQAPLTARQGLRPPATAGQGQQPRQTHRGQHRPAPGRGARPAPHEEGRHREREDDRERAEGLDQTQRPVREGRHVQQGAETVQPHRHPPDAPSQRRERAVRRGRRDLFLDDRATRVRQGGHEAEQGRQRQCTHEVHNARPDFAIPPPTGGHESYSWRSTGVRDQARRAAEKDRRKTGERPRLDAYGDTPHAVCEPRGSGFGCGCVGSVQFPFWGLPQQADADE